MRPYTASTPLARAAARTVLPREQDLLPRGGASRRAICTALDPSRQPAVQSRHAPQPRLRPSASSSLRPDPRAYHSYSHPPPPGPFNPTEQLLLSSAYAHVPAHGFTAEALALGARDAGYLDISTNLLPNGVFDLILWHLVARREALVGRAAELDAGAGGLRTDEKVFELTWQRLLGNQEVVGRWQEALAIMAQPSYVPASLRELAQLADDVWFLAGDRSVDPTWYTKRASLSAAYVAAELFMTTDASPGFAHTRAFLRRRLDEVAGLGSAAAAVGEWLSFTAAAGVNVLRSKGAPI